MPSPFRRGKQDAGEELGHAGATVTAEPGDSHAGEEQAEPHDGGSVSGEEARTAHAGQQKVRTKVIVLAGRQAADGHEDAYVFDGPEQAVEFVRNAVEEGMEPDQIHVFVGAETRLHVAFRVEVSLGSPEGPDPV